MAMALRQLINANVIIIKGRVHGKAIEPVGSLNK
jgi:hypothetical protein